MGIKSTFQTCLLFSFEQLFKKVALFTTFYNENWMQSVILHLQGTVGLPDKIMTEHNAEFLVLGSFEMQIETGFLPIIIYNVVVCI